MLVTTKFVRHLFIAAGLTAFAASANAFVFGLDPQIIIDHAIDSPTLTIRYKGVTASLVELQINGVSVGTRSVSKASSAGETNFTLNMGDLHEGENAVDVRIFDSTGKLVGEEKSKISSAPTQRGPVYLSFPKTGATVQGPVEIKMAFDHDLKDCYVSFFIDGTFKSMTNFPPFTYVWDTERETNGWHELEGWAIDDTSNTHKTGKVRVFVNNPHGDTHRFGGTLDLAPSTNIVPTVTATARPAKHLPKKGTWKVGDLHPLPAAAPVLSDSVLGDPSGTKPMLSGSQGIPMGVRTMLPTNTRVAHHEVKPAAHTPKADEHPGMIVSVTPHVERTAVLTHAQVGKISNAIWESTALVSITKGSRLPNLSSFYVALDSSFVDFHGVLPRVDEGVPMTPLRFLLEKKGGMVNWDNPSKTVFAQAAGNNLTVHIGDSFAFVNKSNVSLEKASYLDRGRTIVPLTFMEKALNVKIQYDKNSNHVLITSNKK